MGKRGGEKNSKNFFNIKTIEGGKSNILKRRGGKEATNRK